MKNIITRNLQGKKVLLFFILTMLVYASMLIISIPKTMSFSNGMKLLDMMPLGYNWEYINTLFTTLGEKGREVYLYNQIPLDMIYPGLFGISYCLIFAFFLNKLNKLNSPLFYLCLLPLIAGMADYFENMGIIILLNTYPTLSHSLASATNIFTIVKSATTTLYFIVLIVVLIGFGIKKLRELMKNT